MTELMAPPLSPNTDLSPAREPSRYEGALVSGSLRTEREEKVL